jgi:hypothetical protein
MDIEQDLVGRKRLDPGRMFVADVKVDAWIARGNRLAFGLQLHVRSSRRSNACRSNEEKYA